MSRLIKVPGQITGSVTYSSGTVTSITITGNVNLLVIPDIEKYSLINIVSTGNFTVNGIFNPNISKIIELKFFNKGSFNVTWKKLNAGAAPEYQIYNATDMLQQPGEGFVYQYNTDATVKKWWCYGKNI